MKLNNDEENKPFRIMTTLRQLFIPAILLFTPLTVYGQYDDIQGVFDFMRQHLITEIGGEVIERDGRGGAWYSDIELPDGVDVTDVESLVHNLVNSNNFLTLIEDWQLYEESGRHVSKLRTDSNIFVIVTYHNYVNRMYITVTPKE